MDKQRAFSFLLAGAACMTGLLTAYPLVAGIVTAIGAEWGADLLAVEREKIAKQLFGGKGELNHDIARALTAAIKNALGPQTLRKDYQATQAYKTLKVQNPAEAKRVDETLNDLARSVDALIAQPVALIEQALTAEPLPTAILNDEPGAATIALSAKIRAFYDGDDPNLIPWLEKRLSLEQIRAHFVEQIKHDTPAFRALVLQMYYSTNVLMQSMAAEIKQHVSSEVQKLLELTNARLAPQFLPTALARLEDLPTDPDRPLPPVQWLPQNSRLAQAHDPAFVGRADLLRQLAAALRPLNAIVVLSGGGGIGKSKLANEFAHRYGAYFAGGVFWLDGSDPAQLADELLACDGLSELPPADYAALNRPQQLAVITRALQDGVPRLLIVDAVPPDGWPAIQAHLPKTGGCRVLLTTRSGVWSSSAVHHLPVGPLGVAASRALLQQIHAALGDADADRIAETLGHHPLALYLVGHYLALTQRSAADFLRGYAERTIDHLALRDPDTQTPVIARLFDINWAWLAAVGPHGQLARTLLAHLAEFAAGTAVPRALLHQTLRQRPLPAAMSADLEELADQLALAERAALQAGLLNRIPDGFQLHPLVAAFVQKIADDAQARIAVEQLLAVAVYERNSAGDLATLRQWRPHLLHVSARALAGAESALATAAATDGGHSIVRGLALATNVGYYLQADGNYAAAAQLFERVLAARTDPRAAALPAVSAPAAVATALNNYGSILKRQDQHGAAQPLLERALALRRDLYGPDHPETAIVLNNLADLLLTGGDAQTALPLFEQALAINEHAAGANAPATASALVNLAACLFALRRYAEARVHYERALAIREQVLGRDHPATALVLVNLAVLLHALGATSGARARLEQALAIQLGALDATHADVAATRFSLALLLIQAEAGNRGAAIEMLSKAAEAWEMSFGQDDRRARLAHAMLAQISQS